MLKTTKNMIGPQSRDILKVCIRGGGGGSNKAWDRETMFSQLAGRSARQRF